jgi:hypothetical protein
MLTSAAAQGTDRQKDLQDRFDRETHASGKVKTLDKLADAQFEVATRAGNTGDFTTVGLTLEKYRDNVKATFELLKKQEPDSEKHASGYRQLELQVRKGMREVEQTVMIAPNELRPPLEIVRKDLLDMDNELIRLLFPRHPSVPEKVADAPKEKQ